MIISNNKIQILKSEWKCNSDTPNYIIEDINNYVLNTLNSIKTASYARKKICAYLNDNYKNYGFSDFNCTRTITEIINKFYSTNLKNNI